MTGNGGTISKILCPIDFSEQSSLTAQTALYLARNLGAEVMFINVVNQIQIEIMERMGGRLDNVEHQIFQDLLQNLEEDRAQRMKELLHQLEAGQTPHSSRVTVGVPWEKITALAEAEGVDLIVMGAHGRGGLTRALRFGTTAEKVFRRAKCRVLFER